MLGGTVALIAVCLVGGALLLVVLGAVVRVELEEFFSRRKVRREAEEWKRQQRLERQRRQWQEEEEDPGVRVWGEANEAELELQYEEAVEEALKRRRELYMLWLHDMAAGRETELALGFSQGPGEGCVMM